MQGINRINFEKGINFHPSNGDESVQLRYFNSIIDAFELACPGWFDNIELVVTRDSNNYPTYTLNFIINNISLLEITTYVKHNYEYPGFRIRTYYDNGNSYYTPYKSNGTDYDSSKPCVISAIIYSNNFCAIETSTRTGTENVSTTIIFCKTNENNTAIIMPSSLLSNSDTTNYELLTTYYNRLNDNDTYYRFRIAAHTVYSGFRLLNEESNYGKCNNKFHNNYLKSSSYYFNGKTEALQSRTFINTRVILTPMYITDRTQEYCLGVYYIQNIPVTLTSACNTVLEIGKDFYFTNGVIAVKLT